MHLDLKIELNVKFPWLPSTVDTIALVDYYVFF